MKRSIGYIILGLLVYINPLASQQSINAISKLGHEVCIFTESFWKHDTLFVAGTSGSFNSGFNATIAKYDLYGNILEDIYLLDDSKLGVYSFLGHKGIFNDGDQIFHIAEKRYNGNEEVGGVIFIFNGKGDIWNSNIFQNYFYPEKDEVYFRDFKKVMDGFIISDYSASVNQDGQSCLLRLDDDLNQVWRYCYGNTSKEIPSQVFQLSNGHFVVLSNSTNMWDDNEYSFDPGYLFHRAYIFETDEDGNLLWEWRSPDRSERAYAGVLENDSILVVAAGLGFEECIPPDSKLTSCKLLFDGGVYKFNLRSRQKIWESSLSCGPPSIPLGNSYLDIVPSMEKDGYIVCGVGYEVFPDCRIDTVDKCWSSPGIIAKMSNEGDSLWSRKYFGVTDIYESNILYDAEITPDSGYSFVGEAFNPWPGQTQGQHGWLLMTDRYGCLVPGCHLISSTAEEELNPSAVSSSFKIHPNPATDIVNVLITSEMSREARLHLFDQSGHEMDSWIAFEKGATYMIPVHQFPAGMYILTMTDGAKILSIEKLIIQN